MKQVFEITTAIIILTSFIILGCSNNEDKISLTTKQQEPSYTISITQIVEHPALDAIQQGFKDRLAQLGVPAEYNIHIAQGDMAINEQIASQIKGEAPDLVLAISTPSAINVIQKIKDIPILFAGVTDPVAAKLVKNMNAPGANVTGLTDMGPMDKQVELIREFLPNMKTLGLIYNAGETNSAAQVDILKTECAKYDIKIRASTVDNSAGVIQATQSLVGKVDALYVPLDNTVVSAFESALKVCTENMLPLFAGDAEVIARGAIAAVAIDYYKLGIQTADMAKRIFDGADVSTMPVESLQELSLHVNTIAAANMGISIPEAVLSRADIIID